MAVKFRKFRLEQARPGMVLGSDVISARGKIMLSANTMLTDKLINRLTCWGFDNIEVVEDDSLNEKLKNRRMTKRLQLNRQYEQTVAVVRKAFEEMRQHREVPLEQMEKLAEDTLGTLVAAPGVLGYLHSLRSMDNYTFQHSVNVGVIVGVLGKWLGYEGELLKNYVLAGLLHDVGKALVPLEILNKPGKLTRSEMEMMQRHCVFGYEMLRRAKVTSQEILTGVRQHHERLDGSGYPQGIRGDKIRTCARIIAIADTYDAMTSDRIYRESVAPFGAIKTQIGRAHV